MAGTTVKVNELKIDLASQIDRVTKQAAEDMVQELRGHHWKDQKGRKSGEYNAGWTYNVEKDKVIVFNKTDGSLTHLLEKGHVIKQYKRLVGFSPAIPHIKPAFNKIKKQYQSDLKKIKIEPKG